MKRLYSRLVEPLESRIAPAVIHIGATGVFENITDTEYTEVVDPLDPNRGPRPDNFDDLAFIDTSKATDPISTAVDSALSDNTFYLRLRAGDTVFRLTEGNNYKEFIKVSSGNVIAFFTDFNGNNDFDDGELTGLALGANVNVVVNGSVNGDVLTILDEHGTRDIADDTLDMDGLVSAKQGIDSLRILGGSVFGSVLSGGAIKSLTIAKDVKNVLAGNAFDINGAPKTLGFAFDLFKDAANGIDTPGGNGTIADVAALSLAKQAGASITNAVIGSITDTLAAGIGGFGAKGGSLTNIQVTADSNGLNMVAGAGGVGDAASRRVNGGAGGDAINIFIGGVLDSTPNSGTAVALAEAAQGTAATPETQTLTLSAAIAPNASFQLRFGTQTTALLPFSASAAAIQAELNALAGIGALGGVTVLETAADTFAITFNANGNQESISVISGQGIAIKAGKGGDGLTTAKGGPGGVAKNIQVGFELAGTRVVPSGDLVADSVEISAGAGGSGRTGGAGASATDIDVRIRTPDTNGNEIAVFAGAGGASSSPGGKAGIGGGVRDADLRNQISTPNGDILVQAGSGGSTPAGGAGATSAGAAGGSVLDIQVLGFDVQVVAGNGSDGKVGGAGGSAANVSIIRDDFVIPRNILVNAGHGGAGFASKGGGGGDVRNLQVANGDFESFIVNDGIAGDGGEGFKGAGGKGGSVETLIASDIDSNIGQGVSLEGFVDIRSGRGGDGTKGGALGGTLRNIVLNGNNLNVDVEAGAGGAATLKGKGGAGGRLDAVQVESDGTVNGISTAGNLRAGAGGAGAGSGGSGGGGGEVRNASLSVDGDASIFAGGGGSGQAVGPGVKGGAPGAGGAIVTSGLFAQFGSGEMRAGDAGPGGAKPAAGGSISGLGVKATTASVLNGIRAAINVTAVAGNGSHGGPGGDILGLTYGSTAITLTPTPVGAILIRSGDGSADGKVAGRGGNISNVDGAVSSGVGQLTQLLAGDAGGGAAVTKPAPGGSISNITISRGGAADGTLLLEAGDAGDAPLAKKGATGGSVRNVGVTDIHADTIFRSVAAGNGGRASKLGGPGGSIDVVFVRDHDIGIRTGATYGYTEAGGLFAGTGGASDPAVRGAKDGVNGNVTNISANAISSVVAGRVGAPRMAEKVADIYVAGDDTTLLLVSNESLVPNGDFKLRFGVDETPVIESNSSAAEVQAALNLLPGIAALGGVTVSSTPNFGYAIRFNNPGNQAELSGIEIVRGEVDESVKGAITAPPVTSVVGGETPLSIAEVRSGDTILNVLQTNPGAAFFTTSEQQGGSAVTFEVQVLDLSALAPFPTGEFTLTFNGFTTGSLPGNATAIEIQTALNSLASVAATGPGGAGGTVTVVPIANATARFTITFNNFGAQSTITGSRLVPEIQRLDVSPVTPFPNGEFELTFGGFTTVRLASTATAADIENELNALPSIFGAGFVTVAQVGPGLFNIRFGANGDQASIVGTGFVPELQRIPLGVLAAGATFRLAAGNEVTPELPVGASASQVQAALNQLPSVQAAGGVSVALSAANTFDVTFLRNGDMTNFTGVALQNEQQSIDLSGVSGATSEFTLAMQHVLATTETDQGESLPLDVTDAIPQFIVASFLATTNFNGNTSFAVPVTETTAGSGAVQEVQTINLTNVQPNHEFQLRFDNDPTDTIPASITDILPANATAAQIEAALNGLATIVATGTGGAGGSVTVAAAGGNNFRVTFTNTGNQPLIVGLGGEPEQQSINLNGLVPDSGEFVLTFQGQTTSSIPGGINASPAVIEAALDALPVIAALSPSGVTVVQTAAGVFQIDFNAVGNQPTITGITHSFSFKDFSAVEIVAAAAGIGETQRLDLNGVVPVGAQFVLDFGGQSTAVILGGPNVSAATIDLALEALPIIPPGANPPLANGGVTVTQFAPGIFDIRFNNAPNVDQPPVTGTSHTRVPQPGEFSLATATVVQGTAIAPEVQRLDLVKTVALGGNFSLVYATERTGVIGIPNGTNTLADDIAAALNALVLISEVGGVSVVETAPGSNIYDITFGANGDPQPITGTARVPETQQVDVNALGALVNGEFTLTFNGQESVTLPFGATPLEVERALNALPSIASQGGVTVVETHPYAPFNAASPSTYRVDFRQIGFPANQPEIVALGGGDAEHEHQLIDLGSLNAYTSGFFQLSFGGQKAAVLPVTASAADVEAVLNSLPAINAVRTDFNPFPTIAQTGQVSVTQLGQGLFDVEFNVFGDQQLLLANGAVTIDRYPIQGAQTDNGESLPVLVSEKRGGSLQQAEVVEVTRGGAAIREVQRIDLSALAGATTGDFVLGFGPLSTTALPANATALQVEAALDAVPSIAAVGGVSVQALAGNAFDVTFDGFGNQVSLVALLRLPEIQTIDLGGLTGLAGGEFTLDFGRYTTAPLPVGATAAQIEAALNGLPSVQDAGGVSVAAAAGKFDVSFARLGDMALLAGVGGGTAGREQQQISLGSLAGIAGAQFKLTFDGQNTAPIASTATAAEIGAALNALDSVKATRSDRSGAVAVTQTAPGTFTVVFNTFGDQPTLTGKSLVTTDRVFASAETIAGSSNAAVPVTETTPGTAVVREVQTINLVNVQPNREFQLSFDDDAADFVPADRTPVLPANATAGDIETALNNLAAITAAGGVTVAAGAGNTFNVTFNDFGNQPSIVGSGGNHERQTITLGELGTFPSGLFRLVFNGEASRAVNVSAPPAELEAALDAMATIKALRSNNMGGVTVQQPGPGVFTIDFDDLGNQPAFSGIGAVAVEPPLDVNELIAGADFALPVREALAGLTVTVPTSELTPGTAGSQEVQRIDLANVIGVANGVFQLSFGADETAFLPRFAKAPDIAAALNALASITAVGGVTVAAGPGNTFDVTFVSNGNQPLLIGGAGGVQETQQIDAALLLRPGNSEFTLTFGGDTTPTLAENSTAADIEAELNALASIQAAGGVTVLQKPGGFEVRFNEVGNQGAITGNISIFEQQVLDVHKLPTVENGEIRLSFGANSTGPLDADSVAPTIETELNALASIQAAGGVTVVALAPGVFRIDFNGAGNKALIAGTANTFGTTERLGSGSTTDEIEAALDSVSFVDIDVTAGALPGVVTARFLENLDQPLITAKGITHEQQRIDIYAVGDFSITFNDDTTALLPISILAAADGAERIRAELNRLPDVIAIGGVTAVTIGANSSLSVTFGADNDTASLVATQVLAPLPITTLDQGVAPAPPNLGRREVQLVNFTPKGAFVAQNFNAATFVGSIVDFNEIDSNTFHFTELNGLPGFNEGDMPIDGIVMAKLFDQTSVNFVPEAKFTATGFFDHNNTI